MSRIAASKQYWDAHPIGVEPFEAEAGTPEFFNEYLSYYDGFLDYKQRVYRFEQYAGRDVLEIGCGLGLDTVKFARAGANLTAIDLSDTSVDCTRRLLDGLGLRADVRRGAAEELDFPDGSFDVVFANGVLPHVDDERRAVGEIRRVLRPGGEALAMLYHRRSWYWLLVKLTGTAVESELGDPPIIRVHSRREARELFHRFARVEIDLERFPKRTRRRAGLLAGLYNGFLVPVAAAVPRSLMKPFGWHIIIRAAR